jgi:hypothetical protein
MTAFFFAASISFLLYQILAYSHVPRGVRRLRIGSIGISFAGSAGPWARRVLRFLIVTLVLACTVFIHDWLSPINLFSQNKIGIILGFLFGPLFGIWFNAVIAHGPGDSLSWGLIIGGTGLILLFLMGSLGNDAGEVIRQYARNLSSVKVGGAEFAFEKARKESPGLGALPPAYKTFTTHTGSAGLQYLALLDDMIESDREYLQVFGQSELKQLEELPIERREDLSRHLKAAMAQLEAQLKAAHDFTVLTITRPLTCLAWWHGVTQDSAVTDRHLRTLSDVFRHLQKADVIDDPTTLAKFATDFGRSFVKASLMIASDISASAAKVDENNCEPLLEQFCPPEADSKPVDVDANANGRVPYQRRVGEEKRRNKNDKDHKRVVDTGRFNECIEKLLARLNDPSPVLKGYEEKVIVGLRAFLVGRGLATRPYFAIAYASIMAHLGQYEAAGAILDGWLQLRSNPLAPSSDWETGERWLDTRARSILAAYGEEWLRKETVKEGGAPTTLFNEHIENLRALRVDLYRRMIGAKFFKNVSDDLKKKIDITFKKSGSCAAEGPDVRRYRALFNSYVSVEVTYVQATLRHPDYEKRFAETTTSELNRLVNLDLSCIPDRSDLDLYYAQILESFARNTVKYSQARAKIDSEETKKKRLDQGEQAARFALETLQDAADSAQQNRLGLPLLKRIEPSSSVETRELLGGALADIQKARRELTQ